MFIDGAATNDYFGLASNGTNGGQTGISPISVDGIGEVLATPYGDDAGNQATVSGAAAQGAFQIKSMVLANGRGSSWSDPDIGDWQGNSCTMHTFDWAA